MSVELLTAFGVVVGLVVLLVWTSRRWGRPRLYMSGAAALWVLAALLAVVVLAIVLR